MPTSVPPPGDLPGKQPRFYYNYLGSLNATQAAILAGYSVKTANKSAYLWVGDNREKCPKPYRRLWDAVHKAKEQQIERIALTPARVLEEWMAIGFFNIQDLFDPETGNPIPLNELPPETVTALESIQVLKETTHKSNGGVGGDKTQSNTAMVKFKGHNKVKALEFLSKYLRLDPTQEYKQGGAQGAGSEKSVIKNVLGSVDGATRGLPAPVHEIPEHFNLAEDEE